MTDRDGDVWTLWWNNSAERDAWSVVGGTGKYAGLTGSGTTTTEVEHADDRFSITYEGTVDLK